MPVSLDNKMRERALERFQDAYRDTWTEDETRHVLSKWQHMMLWSDADIADEFTTLRDDEGRQAYHPEVLKSAMHCYRLYQRQLWDPIGEGALPRWDCPIEEWQFRTFGAHVGVFLLDTRGGRISSVGEVIDGPLLTDQQRASFVDAIRSPDLLGLIVGTELPVAVETPADLMRRLDECSELTYLRDQWAYHAQDMEWLLEQVFEWRAARPGREAVFVSGGGLNCALETSIHDKKTGAVIRQVVTSPVTSFTSPFLMSTSGEMSHRFYFRHKVLPQRRSYCTMDVSIDRTATCTITAELVTFPAMEMSLQDKIGVHRPKEKRKPLNPLQSQAAIHELLRATSPAPF